MGVRTGGNNGTSNHSTSSTHQLMSEIQRLQQRKDAEEADKNTTKSDLSAYWINEAFVSDLLGSYMATYANSFELLSSAANTNIRRDTLHELPRAARQADFALGGEVAHLVLDQMEMNCRPVVESLLLPHLAVKSGMMANKLCASDVQLSESAELPNGAGIEGEGEGEGHAFREWGHSPTYDFYTSPHVVEARSLAAVLPPFMVRISELLQEWPEHPILLQIAAVIDRLLSFTLDSPLAKLLTGLDMVLAKAHAWQANASSRVSIANHIEAVVTLVLRWRRLELRCWSLLLEKEEMIVAQRSDPQWLLLFKLTVSVPWASGCTETDMVTAAAKHKQTCFEYVENYIHESNLGEFIHRLDLIRALAAHLLHTGKQNIGQQEKQQEQGKEEKIHTLLIGSNDNFHRYHRYAVGCMLLHLHTYFSQFVDDIQHAIRVKKVELENEVKEFVQLLKWRDTNFYSMKEAALKAQRNLTKFATKYEAILEQPALPVLQQHVARSGLDQPGVMDGHSHTSPKVRAAISKQHKKSKAALLEVLSSSGAAADKSLHAVVVDVDSNAYGEENLEARSGGGSPAINRVEVIPPNIMWQELQEVLPNLPDYLLRGKAVRYASRARRVIEQRVLASETGHIVTFFELPGDMIARIKYLQSWQPTEVTSDEASGEKSKKEEKDRRKHGVLMRRTALADLFKLLKRVGFSYRLGLLKAADPMEGFSVPALSFFFCSSEFSDKRSISGLHNVLSMCQLHWTKSEIYYMKNSARIRALRHLLTAPRARDLSPLDLSRCSGFSEHIFAFQVEQRQTLSSFWSKLLTLLQAKGACDAFKGPVTWACDPVYLQYCVKALKPILDECADTLVAILSVLESRAVSFIGLSKSDSVETKQETRTKQRKGKKNDMPTENEDNIQSPTSHSDVFISEEQRSLLDQHKQQHIQLKSFLEQCKSLQEQLDVVCIRLYGPSRKPHAAFSNLTLPMNTNMVSTIKHLLLTTYSLAESVQSSATSPLFVLHDNLGLGSQLQRMAGFIVRESHLLIQQGKTQSSTTLGRSHLPSQTKDTFDSLEIMFQACVERILLCVQHVCHASESEEAKDSSSLLPSTALSVSQMKENGEEEGGEHIKEKEDHDQDQLSDGHFKKLHERCFRRLATCENDSALALRQLDEFFAAAAASVFDAHQSTNPTTQGSTSAIHAGNTAVTMSEGGHDAEGVAMSERLCSMMSCLGSLLGSLQVMAARLLLEGIVLHRSLSKLEYILLNLFADLANKGFCAPQKSEEQMEGEAGTETVQGTGMGEGEGNKDVSKEIESEEQIEGLQGEQTDNKEDVDEHEDGIEMSQDFDADLQDVKGDEDKEGDSQDESDDDNDEQTSLDEQMGDLDGQGETLDDDMWGDDDSSKEEDNNDKAAEAGPQHSRTKGTSELGAEEGLPEGNDDKEDKEEDIMDMPDDHSDVDEAVNAKQDELAPDPADNDGMDFDDNMDFDGSDEEKDEIGEREMDLDLGGDGEEQEKDEDELNDDDDDGQALDENNGLEEKESPDQEDPQQIKDGEENSADQTESSADRDDEKSQEQGAPLEKEEDKLAEKENEEEETASSALEQQQQEEQESQAAKDGQNDEEKDALEEKKRQKRKSEENKAHCKEEKMGKDAERLNEKENPASEAGAIHDLEENLDEPTTSDTRQQVASAGVTGGNTSEVVDTSAQDAAQGFGMETSAASAESGEKGQQHAAGGSRQHEDHSSARQSDAINPLRSLGDVSKAWKERLKVCSFKMMRHLANKIFLPFSPL